jgi:hypothetical protein
MSVGGISGVAYVAPARRNSGARRKPAEESGVKAPSQHTMGSQPDPRRRETPQPQRKGLMA